MWVLQGLTNVDQLIRMGGEMHGCLLIGGIAVANEDAKPAAAQRLAPMREALVGPNFVSKGTPSRQGTNCCGPGTVGEGVKEQVGQP